MQLFNQTKNLLVLKQLEIPTTMGGKMRGLLGRDELANDSGMLLSPCRWVQSFGMRFTIDLVFLDRQLRIVALQADFKPNRLSAIVWRASQTLELSGGALKKLPLSLGDALEVRP